MADTEPKSQSFFKSVGGIITSVITAVLTAVLIAHFVPSKSGSDATTDTKASTVSTSDPLPPSQVELDGTVANSTTQQLVSDANVTVTVGTNSISQKTDTGGRYAVVLPATDPKEQMGKIDISADGYRPYSNTHLLRTGDDNFAGIPIDSLAPPPAAAPLPGAGPHVQPIILPHNAFILSKPPTNYMKREFAQAIVFPKKP